jgi:hypothetical protein
VAEADLRDWIEASNASSYRRDVLRKAHKQRLLQYDDVNCAMRISPKGAQYAEEHLPLVA